MVGAAEMRDGDTPALPVLHPKADRNLYIPEAQSMSQDQCQEPSQEGNSHGLVQQPNARLQAPLASPVAAWPDIIVHSFLHTHAKIPAKLHSVLACLWWLLAVAAKPNQ